MISWGRINNIATRWVLVGISLACSIASMVLDIGWLSFVGLGFAFIALVMMIIDN